MQTHAVDTLSALDKIFNAFVTQSTDDYTQGGVQIKALAVLENKTGGIPFTVLPIYEPFDLDPTKKQLVANRPHVGGVSKICMNMGTSVAMFMVAFDGVSESKEHGLHDTLMVSARRSDGASIAKVYLRAVEGGKGGLIENPNHDNLDWQILSRPRSVENAMLKYLMDALWKEYAVGLSTEKALAEATYA